MSGKSHESAEMYLETLLVLEKRKGTVRAVDVAAEMGFSKPSVSVAMKHLRESGHVQLTDEGAIALTAKGRELAESVYERHTLLTRWLTGLGVDAQTAAEDACKIEHVMSAESFEKLKASMA